jgi:biotin-(acetyl-CoA carboxylase) ligase
MFDAKRPLAINISNLHKVEASPSSSHRDHSPGLAMRRRRTKVERVAKTNEELICESHEMLMSYVDSIDEQVRHLLDNHEAQFLVAYRKHSTKVKEEVKQIQKQMLENAHN